MNGSVMLALVQSFGASCFIFMPFMYFIKAAIVKFGTYSMQIKNWPDDVVRGTAMFVFMTMVVSAILVMLHWDDWFGLLGPIQVFLALIFLPLYKEMD